MKCYLPWLSRIVPGLAGIIHRHAGGQVIGGPAIQEVERLPQGDRGHVRWWEGDRLRRW